MRHQSAVSRRYQQPNHTYQQSMPPRSDYSMATGFAQDTRGSFGLQRTMVHSSQSSHVKMEHHQMAHHYRQHAGINRAPINGTP